MLEMLFSLVNILNTNKLFWGFAMLTMNIGSRFVIGDITKLQEKFVSHFIVKKFVLFCMFFIATRDVVLSLFMAFIFTLTLQGILNDRCRYNIIPKHFIHNENSITLQQYNEALNIITAFEKQKRHVSEEQHSIQRKIISQTDPVDLYEKGLRVATKQ